MSALAPAALAAEVPLEVRGISARYDEHLVVRDVDLDAHRGEIVGLAGESGCGKSTLALAMLGYEVGTLVISSGSSLVEGEDLLGMQPKARRRRWGSTIAYVPQGAAASLNPAQTVRTQFRLVLRRHLHAQHAGADAIAREWIERVGLDGGMLERYAHQLSGGQQQRVSLALALACRPSVLILDEPTAGLDVTTQAQITAMLRGLVDELGLAVVYVSHDLYVLGGIADRVAVMYAGEIAEIGPAADVLTRAHHPYSAALLAAAPRIDSRQAPVGIAGSPPLVLLERGCAFTPRCAYAQDDCARVTPAPRQLGSSVVRCHHPLNGRPAVRDRPSPALTVIDGEAEAASLLATERLECAYGSRGRRTVVVSDVDLSVGFGETVAVVGESGSGKSTLLRALAGIHADSRGEIRYEGRPVAFDAARRPREQRAAVQIVFQNSDLSLNPRRTAGDAIGRSLKLFRSDVPRANRQREIRALLDLVKLPSSAAERFPGDLSGGQRQRVAFARAFASRPRVLLCDEVTSALDVSVQATILELLRELSAQFGTAVLFVSHDLAVVRSISRRIYVMERGRVCEVAATERLFAEPQAGYTKALLAAAPTALRARGNGGTYEEAAGERRS